MLLWQAFASVLSPNPSPFTSLWPSDTEAYMLPLAVAPTAAPYPNQPSSREPHSKMHLPSSPLLHKQTSWVFRIQSLLDFQKKSIWISKAFYTNVYIRYTNARTVYKPNNLYLAECVGQITSVRHIWGVSWWIWSTSLTSLPPLSQSLWFLVRDLGSH